MESYYFFIYLLYGLAFIALGIYASSKRDTDLTHIPLVKYLKYIGAFGVAHGMSEWVTMVIITDLYEEQYIYLFYIKQILKALSFTFLLYFAASLLTHEKKYQRATQLIPIFIFSFWSLGMCVLVQLHGWAYHIDSPEYNTILLRYFMGLPGGLLAGWAIYRQTIRMDKKKMYDVRVKYKRLAIFFFFYGIVDGLIVKDMGFFPTNVINDTVFIEVFKIPIQLLKILLGVGISHLLLQVINTFDWERKEKLKQLELQKTADEERKKLGLEVHDNIIQNIYAVTLKIKYLLKITGDPARLNQVKETLEDVVIDLGEAIKITREFISESTMEQIKLEELKNRLELLVEKHNRTIGTKEKASLEGSGSFAMSELSTKAASNIYYIIQEALNNSCKHANGTYIKIKMKSYVDGLYITVIDDGAGVSLDNVDPLIHFGIKSMCARAEQIGGTVNIRNANPGTEVELIIPWGC